MGSSARFSGLREIIKEVITAEEFFRRIITVMLAVLSY